MTTGSTDAPELPPVGTRVTVRYRRPAGSQPPLTDVIGHLLAATGTIAVRTKAGEVIRIEPASVVAVRVLTDAPVRTSQIRALEHAAALAWPGAEQQWLDGWLLRFGHGITNRANSALPLDVSASSAAIPAIAHRYRDRGLSPRLSIPDRLLTTPGPGYQPTHVMVRALGTDIAAADGGQVSVAAHPDQAWLTLYERPVPVDVLTAVIDGQVGFGMIAGAAVGRAAVTTAPDGTRWLGISAVHVPAAHRRNGHARTLCSALLSWGRDAGATKCYVQVLTDNDAAITLYTAMGFTGHHRSRYVDVAAP